MYTCIDNYVYIQLIMYTCKIIMYTFTYDYVYMQDNYVYMYR